MDGTSTPSEAASSVLTVWLRRSVSLRWLVLFLPTMAAAGYYLTIAADQYESEARFVVRSASRPDLTSGMAILAQLGLSRSQDDSFVVQEFMVSRDAIVKLRSQLPLAAMFNRDEADFVARFPSFIYGPEDEEFYLYYKRMVSVSLVDRTGISTLRVRAFRPDDSRAMAEELLVLGEDLVNRINQRLQRDSVAQGVAEVRTAQARVIEAQAALTEFRNRELIVDPQRNAVALAELIARLSSELGSTQAQISEVRAGSAGSPQLAGLQRKSAALEEQITRERARIAGEKDGLASRIAAYERLGLEREFANRMLGSAETELARAKAEATRQLLYLERIVEPNRPDYAQYPERLRSIITVFAANLLLVMIAWLVWSGLREHADRR